MSPSHLVTLLSPLWLLALLPWAAITWYLLTGRHTKTPVPFLNLWHGGATVPKPKATLHPPPAYVICIIAALLLAVLAATRPRVSQTGFDAGSMTIIVDRGVTMSAGKQFQSLAESVSGPILNTFGAGPAKVVFVPGPTSEVDRKTWSEAVQSYAPTAIDTTQSIDAAVRASLYEQDGPIVVLTDHSLSTRDPRVVRIGPTTRPRNAGIVALDVRAKPMPQLMVTLRNQSEFTTAEIEAGDFAANQHVSQPIDLPPRDQERNYFFDLPQLGRIVYAKVNVNDDLPADNTAWLVRQRTWPSIQLRGDVPPTLQKMIDVYSTARPPAEESRRIVVADSLFSIPSDFPAAGMLTAPPRNQPLPGAMLRLEDHPVVESVNWPEVVRDATAGGSPGEGWRPVVSSGDRIYVAVRDRPMRGVWVGFTSDVWSKSPDFVVFWTNVFDWLGQAGDQYVGGNVVELNDDWQLMAGSRLQKPGNPPEPGVYRRKDGAIRAMNALNIRFDSIDAGNWTDRLTQLGKQHSTPHGFDLTSSLIAGALVLAGIAVSLWKTGYAESPGC